MLALLAAIEKLFTLSRKNTHLCF